MHVANKELSEELYGLSGWNDTPLVSIRNYHGIGDETWATGVPRHEALGYEGEDVRPEYTLGYLLRKLPAHTAVLKLKYQQSEIDSSPEEYGAVSKTWKGYSAKCHGLIFHADTPEDATAKLCIELFKQKILTRES